MHSRASYERPDGRLILLPQRAAFDPDQGLLLLADVHLGKAAAFRHLGVAVPAGTTQEMLDRLESLVSQTAAREIVFLGDLLHNAVARRAAAVEALSAWRCRHPALGLTLVRGNHDRRAGDPPSGLGVDVVDGPLRRGPWSLAHEPWGEPLGTASRRGPDQGYRLCGHVHPGVLMRDPVGGRLRLPAFRFGPDQGLLPAFGGFTGLHAEALRPDEAVWAVLPDGDSGTDGGLVVRVPAPG